MHDFDTARQQFINAVAHDGVGLAATDLHQHPGPGCRLDDLRRQGPCNAMVTVLVKIFHKLNPRTNPTPWADSSSLAGTHNGLTDFGRQVVREMNRLGMMVDISHVSDKTFLDALETSEAPVIASHSSSRALASAARNMTDEMLRAIAKKGGVVH